MLPNLSTVIFVLWLFSPLLCPVQGADQKANPEQQEAYGLVIGISEYSKKVLNGVRFAAEDAKSFISFYLRKERALKKTWP